MKSSRSGRDSGNVYHQVKHDLYGSELELAKIIAKSQVSTTSTFDSFESKTFRNSLSQPKRHHKPHVGREKWRIGASIAALVATLTALINLSIGAWATSLMGANSRFSSGILVEIFHGDCGRASTMNTWAHLAINIVSTGLLAGSNYCMQCLVAPSRVDVDRAHQRFKWLDIGLPSVRNLRYITARRRWLWVILASSSVPLHLLFNSSFFSSIASMDYYVIFATPGFLEGDRFNYTVPSAFIYVESLESEISRVQAQVLTNSSKFERLENAKCIQSYAKDMITDRRSVIVITSDVPAPENGSVLLAMQSYTAQPEREAYPWICPTPSSGTPGLPQTYTYGSTGSCSRQVAKGAIDPQNWTPTNITADFCLSEKVEEQCGFYANVAIIWTVVVCNIMKLLIMGYIVFSHDLEKPLLTIGDSVASLITDPDPMTENLGPITMHAVKAIDRHKKSDPTKIWSSDRSPPWQPSSRLRWFHAVSLQRWCFTIIYLSACICTIGGLLSPALARLDGDRSLGALYSRGLGKVLIETVLSGWDISSMGVQNAVVSSVLVANSPQLALSFLYFAVNTVLTSMSSANEWSHFSVKHAEKQQPKPLRTSNPVGQQRGTHFLQLPLRFAIPLGVVATILHWLISQSIFLVVVSRYNANGSLESAFELATCGYSPIGMIFVIICGIAMLLCLLGISMIKLDGSIPIVSGCSAAISAACHLRWHSGDGIQTTGLLSSDRDSRVQMVEGPLVWGKVFRDSEEFLWSNEIHSEESKQYSFASGEGLRWREKVTTPQIGKVDDL